MVFYPPPDPPPRRPPPGGKLREEEEESWSAERIHTVAMETLSWCTKKYKGVTRSDQVGVPYIIVGVMMVTGFGVLGLVAALPTKSRAFMVNTWGFLLPALATIGEIDQAKDHRSKPPSVFTGYWVSSEQDRKFDCCCSRYFWGSEEKICTSSMYHAYKLANNTNVQGCASHHGNSMQCFSPQGFGKCATCYN